MTTTKRRIYNTITNSIDACLRPFRRVIHKFIQAYLRHSGGDFHTNPYGPDGRYVVLMNERQYNRYQALASQDDPGEMMLGIRRRLWDVGSEYAIKCWWRTQDLAADYYLKEREFGRNITEQTYYLHQLGEVMRLYSQNMKGRN